MHSEQSLRCVYQSVPIFVYQSFKISVSDSVKISASNSNKVCVSESVLQSVYERLTNPNIKWLEFGLHEEYENFLKIARNRRHNQIKKTKNHFIEISFFFRTSFYGATDRKLLIFSDL